MQSGVAVVAVGVHRTRMAPVYKVNLIASRKKEGNEKNEKGKKEESTTHTNSRLLIPFEHASSSSHGVTLFLSTLIVRIPFFRDNIRPLF